MWRSIRLLWMLLLLCSVTGVRDKSSFLGGTISYTTTLESNGKYKANIEFITGWILGNGPCGPNCSQTNLGTSTLPTRRLLEQTDPFVFGKFFVDTNENCLGVNCTDYIIKHSMTEEVYAINTEARWEQDVTRFSVIVDEKTEDINFEGDFWRPTIAQTDKPLTWHLSIQFSLIRNDTNKPNSLPQVFGRPFYRVKLNEVTVLALAVTDPDGDVLKCSIAEFREGGLISSHKAPGLVVYENCTVEIDASTTNGYFDDSWVAVAVVIRDYQEEVITYGTQIYNPFQFSMLYTTFQFVVNIRSQLEVPRYVSPSPPNGHQYVLYIGVTWTVDLYAEASENTTISEFIDKSRPKFITMSNIKNDHKRTRTRYVTLSWKPSSSDIGKRVACFTARDDTGIDSEEDACISFKVLSKVFTSSSTTSSGKPVFVDIPTRDQLISCPILSTCFVPLYIKSAVDVVSVSIEKYFTQDANVDAIEHFPEHGPGIYKTDLSFTDSSHGVKQLCFIAVDKNGAKSDETCVVSEIEPLNPCISNPCLNSGVCSVDKHTGTFNCKCLPNFYGKTCDGYDDPCSPNPCQNGGSCLKKDNKGLCFCVGFSGDRCEIDINYCTQNSTCSGHGACKDGKTNFTCECMERYTGNDCETDTCQTSTVESASCPIASCKNVNCSGHGICTEGGRCKCSSGFSGNNCETAKGPIQLNSVDIAFVPPSLQAGSTVVCYLDDMSSVLPCAVDAFVVTSNGVKPTISIKMSPELDKETIIRPVNLSEDVEGVTGVYYSQLIVKGKVTLTTNQFACIIASTGTSKIERCYEVNLIKDPAKNSSTIQFAQYNAPLHFIPPTPKEGSTLICTEDEECHLVLYTRSRDINIHTCEHVISTSKDVFVFAPHRTLHPTFGPCVSEVLIKPKGNMDRTVCFLSALKDFQQRCFKIIYYPPNSDPCINMPCKNGGLCLRTGLNDFKCNCPTMFSGDTCQNGPCLPTENVCQNNAHCQKLENTASCICQLGFSGQTCNIDTRSVTTSTIVFTNTAKPDTLQCVLHQPCSVTSVLAGSLPGGAKPTGVTGYVSPALDVVKLSVEDIQNDTEIYQTGIILQGKSVGLHKACVQVKDGTGSIADEECFKINIVNDVISVYGFQDRPYFIEPSLPTDTTVNCPIDDTCHVLYKVTTGDGNQDKCVSVKTIVSRGPLNTHLYTTCDDDCQSADWSGSCSVDVAFATPSTVGYKSTVCIELSIKAISLVGEQRCFDLIVAAKPDITEHKGCRWLQCKNGGFCDGRDSNNPFCICPRGYTGTLCDKDATNVDPSGSISTNFVGDNAIPKEIICSSSKLCAVPFQVVQKPGETTSLQYGFTDYHLKILTRTFVDADNSIGNILVMPSAEGNFKFCQQIVDRRIIKDEMCTSVKVEDVVMFDKKNGPHFTLPTLLSESTVICDVKVSCHIDVNFVRLNKSNHSQFCPDVIVKEETTVDKIHIFDVNSTSKDCVKDVSVIHDREENLRLCLQLVVTGKRGETRCFNIEFVDNVYLNNQHPCRNVECLNSGKCFPIFKEHTSTSKCICRNGFYGNKCESGSSNISWANSFIDDGSSDLRCPPHDVCHVLLSSTKTTQCDKFKECGQVLPGYIYPPIESGGRCFTDVAFITEEVGTSIALCAKSRSDNKTMTVRVEAQGACRTLNCKNGGRCENKSPTEAVCICQGSFTGPTCEKDTISHFDSGFALPKLLTCEDSKPCCFTLANTGLENNFPYVFGHDMDLRVTSGPEFTSTMNDAYITRTCVSGTVGMQHKLCMELVTKLNSSLNVTERVCLLIEITHQATPPTTVQPRFDKVLPEGSNVLCKPNGLCTLPVATTPKNGACEDTLVCGSSTNKVVVSPPLLVNGTCRSTVSWVNGATNHKATICLSAGNGGEERHFLADVTELKFSESKDTSPCMTTICNHGGECIEDKSSVPSKGVCLCRLGYEGSTCEKVSLSKVDVLPGVTGINGSTANQHFVPNLALPKTIQCDEVNPCCVNTQYFGIPNLPPPIGYVDTNLTILTTNTTSAGLDMGVGNKKYYNSMTCVKGVPGQVHRICFQTTTDGTTNGMNIDEICFKVQVNHGGQSNPVSGPRFDKSSFQTGSSVLCQLNTECHMPITTMPQSGKCDRVSTCSQTTEAVNVFNTKLIDGKCLTDIAYRSEVPGHIRVCLSAGPSGEQRTLQIETKNMTSEGFGPCQKLHCKNGGRCMAISPTKAQCDCKEEYGGPTCDINYCDGIHCNNNGKCIADRTSSPPKGVCLCPSNSAGTLCNSAPSKGFSLPGVDNVIGGLTVNQHFIGHSAIPSSVQCDATSPCCISVPYNGAANLPPIIGYHDQSLTIDSGPDSIPAEVGTSDSHISVMCVNGSTDHIHKLCLQTTANGTKEGMNIDEFCTDINISTNRNTGQVVDKTQPHFDKATLTEGTYVVCNPKDECHLSVITAKLNGACPQVKVCQPSLNNVHVFQTSLVNEKCISDIAMRTGDVETKPLCLSAGNSGEERHYVVETKNNSLTGFGSCQKLHCENGGSCTHDTVNDKPVCKCPVGFIGKACDQHVCDGVNCMNEGACIVHNIGTAFNGTCVCTAGFTGTTCNTKDTGNLMIPGVTNLPTSIFVEQHFKGNTAVPDVISCDQSNECCIPLEYSGNKVNPPIVGHCDNDLRILSGPQTIHSNTGSNVAVTCVQGIPGKSQRLCLQTTSNGTNQGINVDEICVEINTKAGGDINTQEHHFLSTLPNGAHVVCKPDSQCHIPVVTSANKTSCDQVTSCGLLGDGAHAFPTKYINGTCLTDISIKTGAVGTKINACFSAGLNGEHRVFVVEAKDPTGNGFGGPCQKLHCRNGGTCQAVSDNNATCTCPHGFVGQDCGVNACDQKTCSNGGLCISDSTHPLGFCLCTVDYVGENCDQVVDKSSMFPGTKDLPTGVTSQQHFIGSSGVPKLIMCNPNKPCCFSVPYYGSKNLPPTIGHHDRNLDVTTLPTSRTPDGTKPNYHLATTCVEGQVGKKGRICLQTTTDGRQTGVNVDEICVEVQVNNKAENKSVSPGQPKFSNSLPDGSVIVCQPNSVCHVPITTAKTAGTCSQMSLTNLDDINAHIISMKPSQDKCISDVAILTGVDGETKQLSISAGPGGERRNYTIETRNTTGTGFGPCGMKHCQNGGRCKAYTSNTATCVCPVQFTGDRCESRLQKHSGCRSFNCENGGLCIVSVTASQSKPKCVCAVGFTGNSCEKVEEQLPLPVTDGVTTVKPPGSSQSASNGRPSQDLDYGPQTFFNKTALPQYMKCDPMAKCCLPLTYHGDRRLPPNIGYHDEDLTIIPDNEVFTLSSDNKTHIVDVCVNGKPNTIHRLCMQTTTNGTNLGVNLDEVCVEIEMKKPDFGSSNAQVPAPGPHFVTNFPDGTELVCKPYSMCHVPVVTETTDGLCEQVTQCSSGVDADVHQFQTEKKDGKCITDIAVQTGKENMIKHVCLSAGSHGENVNFDVKSTPQTAFGPCRELHCLNGGKCLSVKSGLSPLCLCPKDFTGVACETGHVCETSDTQAIRDLVASGNAKCSCVVNGKEVNIIKKKPLPSSKEIYMAAGFGAGGMVGTMVVGIVIYFVVTRLQKKKKPVRNGSGRSRVSPTISPKMKQAHLKNMDF